MKGNKTASLPKVFLIIFLPLFLISLVVYSFNFYAIGKNKEVLKKEYSMQMQQFLHSTESKISDISFVYDSLSANTIVKNAADLSETTNQNFQIQALILNFTNHFSYIDNIAIVNQKNHTVIAQNGIYEMKNYFDNIYIYSMYNYDYWSSYSAHYNSSKILNPDTVTGFSRTSTSSVIPVVFIDAKDDSPIIYIFNISSESIFDEFQNGIFTKNTSLYMLNTQNSSDTHKTAFSEECDVAGLFAKDSDSKKLYNFSNKIINHKRYFVMTSTKRSNSFGYAYIAAIPYSDIEAVSHNISLAALILSVLMIVLSLLYSRKMSNIVNSPFIEFSRTLKSTYNELFDDNSENNDTINEMLQKITEYSISTENNYKKVLSYTQQKYLTSVLNNTNRAVDEDLLNLFFENDYFCSITLSISAKNSQFMNLPVLMNKIEDVIESILAEKYTVYALPSTNNTLYFLLNLDSNTDIKEINATVKYIISLFDEDRGLISIVYGIGDIECGSVGLRNTHQKSLQRLSDEVQSDILVIADNPTEENFVPNKTTENILVNYLLSNYKDKATELIVDICKKCSISSDKQKIQGYDYIFKTLVDVMRQKKLSHPDFDNTSSIDIFHQLMQKNDDEILMYILSIVNFISDKTSTSYKFDISKIVDYINLNYENSYLCLDMLATEFKLSPKYISKKINDYLGVSFKDYITQLRVAKAIDLLINSDIKANDVFNRAGFSSQSSFNRVFKQRTGISPMKYRETHKNDKKDTAEK